MTTRETGSRSIKTPFHLVPQTDSLEIMLHNSVEGATITYAVYAAAILNVVLNRHRQRTRTLWHQAHMTAKVDEFAALDLSDVMVAKQYLAVNMHAFDVVDKAIEGAQQRSLTATRRPYDTRYLVLRNGSGYIFKDMSVANVDVEVTNRYASVVQTRKQAVPFLSSGIVVMSF